MSGTLHIFSYEITILFRHLVKVKSLSCVRLFSTPWTLAYQSPLSMEFSRQEYWSGLPFPSPGDLPDSGIEPRSPALQADALPSESPDSLTFHFPKCQALYIFSHEITILFPYFTSLVAQTVKHLPTVRETRGSTPESGRSPREGKGNPLQYSCLENPMDWGAW